MGVEERAALLGCADGRRNGGAWTAAHWALGWAARPLWERSEEADLQERRSDTSATGGGDLAEKRNCKSSGEARRLRAMEPGGTARAAE